MSLLRVFEERDPKIVLAETTDGERIARELREIAVRFERWEAEKALPSDADQDAVIAAYEGSVRKLQGECGYQAVDVVRLARGTPNTAPMRAKFLSEHDHSEDEVRFFVEGKGAFYLRDNGHIYRVVCERGDLISVPAGTRHWFDMGPDPEFAAIRLFTNPAGWVANFTGDPIADRFPKFE
ncbi:MAG TPA: cupin domain-containing protein [Candidatus Acidoferrales bacterium]|nr:cupin domain-containing protein [Candidatus Acidoferrales bacterium]